MITAADERTIVLESAELAARPVVGSSCCAVPAAEAIKDTLASWPGVRHVTVEVGRGRVEVALDGDRPTAADLAWSLRMLGLEPVDATKRLCRGQSGSHSNA